MLWLSFEIVGAGVGQLMQEPAKYDTHSCNGCTFIPPVRQRHTVCSGNGRLTHYHYSRLELAGLITQWFFGAVPLLATALSSSIWQVFNIGGTFIGCTCNPSFSTDNRCVFFAFVFFPGSQRESRSILHLARILEKLFENAMLRFSSDTYLPVCVCRFTC